MIAPSSGAAPESEGPVDDALVVARGLRKYFPIRGGVTGRPVGFVRAVDGVDLSIRRGTTLGLIGESGCGKTTVGRCLLRLLEPTDGLVTFDGQVLFDGTEGAKPRGALHAGPMRRLRRDMQIVFQDPFGSLNPRMLVSRIVSEGLRAFRHDLADRYPQEAAEGGGRLTEPAMERIVAQLMARVGLNPEHLNRFAHEFSGGQRQRICVARALALKPSFIVLDEPTSALDVSVQAQILNLLKELQRERQLTYLFISHHLAVIRHMCDDVAVMYVGKIVEHAGNERLFEQPLHPYTVALLSAIPSVDPDTRRERIVLEGDVPSPANPPPGCRFHTRCLMALEREVVEAPVTPAGDSATEYTLADPLAAGRSLRLVVDGAEVDPLAAAGAVAYEVEDEEGVGLRITLHTLVGQPGMAARYQRYRDLCVRVEPPLAEAAPGHLVACHFHGEVRQAHLEAQKTGRSIGTVMRAIRAPTPPGGRRPATPDGPAPP